MPEDDIIVFDFVNGVVLINGKPSPPAPPAVFILRGTPTPPSRRP